MNRPVPLWFRVFAGLLLLGIAVFVSRYVAGFMFLLANKSNPLVVTGSTFYEYWYYYSDDPRQTGHLRFAAVAAFVLCFVVPGIFVAQLVRKVRSLHGDARWATSSEVRQSGLLGDTGIILGKYKNRFLMLGGSLFAMLAARTRSGKGVGIVIPNCLNFSDSLVSHDTKQENFDITSAYRARYGQKCYLINPFAEDGRTHRWNALSYINKDPHYRVSDIFDIAYILWPRSDSKDKFFDDQARNIFLGLVLYLMETPELPLTIGQALRMSSGNGKPIKEYLADLIEARENSDRPLSDDCVQALHRFMANSENTLLSILSSFNAPLMIWANPIVDAATSGDDFHLGDVRKKRISIYFGVTPDKLDQAGVITNLFFSQLINQNTKEQPIKNRALKYQCLLLLDEFTAMGRMVIIEKAISYIAGYGLRLLTIIQSVGQLEATYDKAARNMITNHGATIVYPPKEQKDANEISENLGTFTEKSVSRSRNFKRGLNFFRDTGSGGESVSDQKRALMMPQELQRMPQTDSIVIAEEVPPIYAKKIAYFSDHVFLDRLKEVSPTLAALDKYCFGYRWWRGKPTKKMMDDLIASGELAAPVPRLDLDLHIAKVQQRTRVLTEQDVDGEMPLKLETLAHDFSDLPELDDPENPSAESVAALVGDFFSRLEQPEAPQVEDEASPPDAAEVEGLVDDFFAGLDGAPTANDDPLSLSAPPGAVEHIDDDGVITWGSSDSANMLGEDALLVPVAASEAAGAGEGIAFDTAVVEKPTSAASGGLDLSVLDDELSLSSRSGATTDDDWLLDLGILDQAQVDSRQH